MRIIAGKLKNRKISTPKGDTTRPTSSRMRETLFNICQNHVEESEFLDLFAGSGAMGLEALSRGAKRATFVDESREVARVIHQNIKEMGMKESAIVFNSDALKALERMASQGKKYDIVYADPPYGKGFSELLIKFFDEHPLLPSSGVLFIEESKDHPLNLDDLKTLELKSMRKSGGTMLLQLEKKS